ncbi:hypothetical protein [Limosilactobacillus balticus]|uniref:hypothetical protein n=1 Tax=Limosilactobacillus balticus TaxID=2759747 RepID=UPI001E33A27B|nr:hypothetical protein [Limosilactobacillus balticus]MCD7133443.1 hypothetical protein [Limosilactobacillus balticus]
MKEKENKDQAAKVEYVYVCVYQINGSENIVVFDNADALFDWEDAVRGEGGFIRYSNKLDLWSGVAGYPSGETER